MLRWGPDDGPVVVMALPLFEEANRTRALLAETLRRLVGQGIAGALPDLPGQGESVVPTVDVRFEDWCHAFAAACEVVGANRYTVAVRGGALLDSSATARGRYHLSPELGARLVRDLLRARRAAALASGEPLIADDLEQPGPPLTLAGNVIDRALVQALMSATPTHADRVRTVFPEGGTAGLAPPDDGNSEGRPRFARPWAATEPTVNLVLAQSLADDITQWVRACEGC